MALGVARGKALLWVVLGTRRVALWWGPRGRDGLELRDPGVRLFSQGIQDARPVVETKAGPKAAEGRASSALTTTFSLPFQLLP